MDVRNKYVDTLGSWKKTRVRVAYFLCKKITKKQFFKLKTINMMGRNTTLFPRLSSTYYVIGRKKYTCKKGYIRISFGFTLGIGHTEGLYLYERFLPVRGRFHQI